LCFSSVIKWGYRKYIKEHFVFFVSVIDLDFGQAETEKILTQMQKNHLFIINLNEKKHIIRAYPLRWKIKTCFKNLQSNGFDLSKNGFTDTTKIELLLAMVVLLYVFAFVEGNHHNKIKAI